MKANYEWMKVNAKQFASTDDYWYQIQSSLNQIEGLYEGYVAGCIDDTTAKSEVSPSVNIWATLDHPTLEHFLLINAWGDLYQISVKFFEPGMQSRLRGNKELLKIDKNIIQDFKIVERCSSIVKLLPDNSDVVFGHVTWLDFFAF